MFCRDGEYITVVADLIGRLGSENPEQEKKAMQMRVTVFLLLMILLMAGCTSQPVLNIRETRLPALSDGSWPTPEDVQMAILSACRDRGWIPIVIKPGLIEARLAVRTHRAVVDIEYTDNSYAITYKDSENLDYHDGEIHRNYNKWVINLSNSIQKQIGIHSRIP